MIGAQTLTACGPQWLAGLAFCLNAAAFIGMTTVMLPPDMTLPLDRSKIIKICQQTGARSLITPPSLIEDFHNDKASFDFLKDLDFVCYLGAALDHRVGDSLAQQTHLFPVIGSTERGMMLSFESDDTNAWKSYEFVPEMGARFEPVTEEFYELHVDRIPEHDFFQGGFYTFPDLESIATDELYSLLVDKYGTKRWVSCGRKDDLVKLAWLAKFHATDIENAIARHPRVRSVFVGGEGRDVPFIIIEPLENEALSSTDQEKFVEEIYNSAINDVNEGSEAIQIPREMVMLSDPAQPFKRSMKMTIMRKEVEKAYKDHIEALYARWEATKSNGHVK
jgi:acyl-coenzyme A synthetase/AMP-(fatty) acid ligase